MKILFVASECTPFIKTGGLADVVGTLPEALHANGADVRVIIPKYRDIPPYWRDEMKKLLYYQINLGWRGQYCGIEYIEQNGVIYYFVDNEFYFGHDGVYGEGDAEGERFSYFARAVLNVLPHIGFQPDIIHGHDWQAGMVLALLNIQYRYDPFYADIKTVFTIHNLRYQGLFSWERTADLLGINDRYFTPDMLEYYGNISFIKGGIVFADRVTTVSPTYAKEIQSREYGEGLDGLIRAKSSVLHGILNGIDPEEYNPADDMWLSHHFDREHLEGKQRCKADLQEMLGLELRENVPIIAMVTRLSEQKGLDLVEYMMDEIMQHDVQFVLLGKGTEHFEEFFSWAAWKHAGQMAARIELNEPLAHQVYAGADMFLMPSAFEPCGLSQMISMRYGTIPIVRETGGLCDSVEPYNQFTGSGNGFSFANYNAHEMLGTIQAALNCYHSKEIWLGLQHSAMTADFSWQRSAKEYYMLYESLVPLAEREAAEGSAAEQADKKEIYLKQTKK